MEKRTRVPKKKDPVAPKAAGPPVEAAPNPALPFHKKIVLRMRDGSMVKCSTFSHFSAAFTKIKVVTSEGKVESMPLDELKAIFFVREFGGNPSYKAHKSFGDGSPKAGTSVKVKFADGEMLRGKVINFCEGGRGFFLFPADPMDNNERVFVIRGPGTEVEIEK